MQALKGVVLLMTLAIAILMTLIVYGMYQKSQNPDFKFFDLGGQSETVPAAPASTGLGETTPMPPPVPDMTAAAQRAFGDITLALPANARISSASVSGNRLVVVVTPADASGDQVWVVDLATGQVLGRVKTQPAAQP